MQKITIRKEEFQEILSVLTKFPEVKQVDVEYNNNNGIGYTLKISFPYVVNDVATTQTVEITGFDQW